MLVWSVLVLGSDVVRCIMGGETVIWCECSAFGVIWTEGCVFRVMSMAVEGECRWYVVVMWGREW